MPGYRFEVAFLRRARRRMAPKARACAGISSKFDILCKSEAILQNEPDQNGCCPVFHGCSRCCIWMAEVGGISVLSGMRSFCAGFRRASTCRLGGVS